MCVERDLADVSGVNMKGFTFYKLVVIAVAIFTTLILRVSGMYIRAGKPRFLNEK